MMPKNPIKTWQKLTKMMSTSVKIKETPRVSKMLTQCLKKCV